MKSVMNHQFSNTPSVSLERSTFDRSHGHKTTFDAGYLVPIFVDEALPGDTFNLEMTGFARLSTPIYPLMDNLRMETFFFAIPHRLLWSHWVNFCGEKVDPDDTTSYLVPQMALTGTANQTIYDYMGIPTQVANEPIDVSALPFRAYNLVYNEWFRDENLQDRVPVRTGDNGADNASDYTLLRRGKRHDYFTSCLPWPQKGDDVMILLGDTAPVTGIMKSNQTYVAGQASGYETGATASKIYNPYIGIDLATADQTFIVKESATNTGYPDIQADLTTIGPSVNELRQAIQVQRILEKDARAGTRYTEIVRAHFGVTSPDARLQRPEYLGGGSSPVHITPIANQSNTGTGKLGAMGVAAFSGHGFTKSFTEHCVILGIVNVRADLTYQNMLERMWSRQTRYDFYWPTLAHLGEQAVLNKEIYVDENALSAGTTEEVFGYQERYAEYRYKPSRISGKFRSNDANSLDAWHLGLEFTGTPTLDAAFIVDDPPIDRVIAVPTEPHFIFDSYFSLKCARPMPVYSIPGMVDHF